MTRQEFILTLRDGLKKLPPEEIVAATEFYEEYFDEVLESGEKTEEEVLNELGSPKRIANQLRAEYAARNQNVDEGVLVGKPSARKKISAAWWVVIGIVSAPLSIPAAIGAICLLISAIIFILAIAATIVAAAWGSIVTVAAGFMAITSAFSSGLMILGLGMIGLAASAAAGFGLYLGIREAVRAIAKTIRRSREKRRAAKLAEESSARDSWVYVSGTDEDKAAFIREMEADAAEAEAKAEAEAEAELIVSGGNDNE